METNKSFYSEILLIINATQDYNTNEPGLTCNNYLHALFLWWFKLVLYSHKLTEALLLYPLPLADEGLFRTRFIAYDCMSYNRQQVCRKFLVRRIGHAVWVEGTAYFPPCYSLRH